MFHLCFLLVLGVLGPLGILQILGDLHFRGTPGFLSYQVCLVLLEFLCHRLILETQGDQEALGCKGTVYTEGLVLLWAHQFLGLLGVLYCLALHGHQVDLGGKLCHLEVLEVLVDLADLVNQGSPGVLEDPQCLFQRVLSRLCFLSSLAIQGVL